MEHAGSLHLLVVVDGTELFAVDPRSLAATAARRSLDPLTPMWLVDRLPAGRPTGAPDAAARWQLAEQVLVGAQAVGVAAATVDLAVGYATGRRQFGRPIGSFQAGKHLCAAMLVRAETARAAVHAAAGDVDQPAGGDPAPPGLWGSAMLIGLLVTMLNLLHMPQSVRLIVTGCVIIGVLAVASPEKA